MNEAALYKIGYGLYVLSANEDGFDNGCIINTVTQVTNTPNRIAVTVNKLNKTHDMIMATAKFNVTVLSTDVPFDEFKHFGFQSGHDVNKFADADKYERTKNGLLIAPQYANAYISGSVFHSIDLGTHTMFIADVTDAEILNDKESVTYAYYHKNIKPQPQNNPQPAGKVAYRCKICGYIHEGELPEDFVCPLCKHPASDFEKI